MIVLSAATGASKPAGAPAQTVKLAGTISAAGKDSGTTGGTVVVSGENIVLAGAKIDASGHAGGGKVLIGGDYRRRPSGPGLVTNASAKLETFAIPTATTVSVDATSTINASATGQRQRRQGGAVVGQPDHLRGHHPGAGRREGGNGGFVETSSHGQLDFTGNVDAGAPRGAAGTLLLDPSDFYIVPDCLGSCAPSTMTGTQISKSARDPEPHHRDQRHQSSASTRRHLRFPLDQHHLGQRLVANPQRPSRHQYHRWGRYQKYRRRESCAARRQRGERHRDRKHTSVSAGRFF